MLHVDSLLTQCIGQPNSISGVLQPGQVGVVLGRNGAGKSWLLKTLAGLNPKQSGSASFEDHPLRLDRRSALIRGYLAQEESRVFPMTCQQYVLSARNPWLSWYEDFGPADREMADQAIAKLALSHKTNQSIQSLSGGEWQRLRLAALYCQQATLWLMDEPCEHLDPGHIWDTLPQLIRQHCQQGGSVLMVAHDPDWAAQLADQVLVLGDSEWSWDSAQEQLTQETLSQLYAHPYRKVDGRWLAV